MLDSFLRKDPPRRGYVPPASPQAKMQEALATSSSAAPRTDAPAAEVAKPEAAAAPAVRSEPCADTLPASLPGEESVCRLFVGPSIKLKGAEITDCDTLVVEGHVEAGMGSRSIQISEHGVFVGKAGVEVADIRGRFEGELTVSKLLIVRATGHVSGKIRYGKVSIEENGEITGDIAAIGKADKELVAAAYASSPAKAALSKL